MMVIVQYLTGCVEDDYLNEIDRIFLSKFLLTNWASSPRLEITLRRVVLMFSDQQAVTGIALLASGYAQLNSGTGIDSYHWQIMAYLVWFSSLTHLTTLMVLRQYFLNNPAARVGRALLMLATVVMLGVALLPSGDYLWFTGDGHHTIQSSAAIPAVCYFQRFGLREYNDHIKLASVPGAFMVISILVLASGYLSRLLKLSNHASRFTKRLLRENPSRWLRGIRDIALKHVETQGPITRKLHWILGYVLIETSYVWLKALFDSYASMLCEVCIAHTVPWLSSVTGHVLTPLRSSGLLALLGGGLAACSPLGLT